MIRIFNNKNKKFISLILATSIFLGLFLVDVKNAQAISFAGIGIDILQAISSFLLMIAQLFTGLVGKLFTEILNFGFRDTTMIYDAWMITRDIVNMFFILGLVVIAFATILRIETYGMKALLPKLIIVALLINFSFLICGIIIDAAQVVANHFIDLIQTSTDPDAPPDVGAAILSTLKVTSAIKTSDTQTVAITNRNPELTTALNTAFSAAIIAVAGFVLLIGSVLLFIRMGALWALIILVPFAWFFSIFPGKLQTHASRWWDEFLKWTFFAPIYIFFIYLVLKIGASLVSLTAVNNSPDALQSMALTEMMSNLNLFFYYVFLVILLFGAPQVAMSMGIQATGMAKTIVKGGLKGVYKLPGRLRTTMVAPPGWIKAVSPKLARGLSKMAIWTSPQLWKKAIEARKAERIRKVGVGREIGRMQDLLNRVNSVFTSKTHHAERAGQFEVEEEKKDLVLETKRNAGRLIHAFQDAYKKREIPRMKAALELLVEQKDHNDLMLFSDMFDEMSYSDKAGFGLAGKKFYDKKPKDEEDRRYGDIRFKDAMYQLFEKAGASEKETNYEMANLSEIGLRSGAYGLFGMATGEGDDLRRTKDEEQASIAASKYQALTLRDKTRVEHATAFVDQGWDKAKKRYKYAGLSPIGTRIMESVSIGDIGSKRFHEMRDDTVRLLGNAYEDTVKAGLSANAQALAQIAKAYSEKGKEEAAKLAKKIAGTAALEAGEEAGKKAGEKAGKKTKEEVRKELEDLGLK